MLAILSLWNGPVGTWGFADFILLAAMIAIMIVALQYFGVSFPPAIVRIFWICVVAFVAIVGIRYLASL